MDNQKLEYRVERATDLRREPTMQFRTKKGKPNVIFSMPFGTSVTRETDEVRNNEGYEWYFVKPEGKEEPGWAIGSYLMYMPLLGGPLQGVPDVPPTDIKFDGVPVEKLKGKSVGLRKYPTHVDGSVKLVTFKIKTTDFQTSVESWNGSVSKDEFKI